MTEKSKTNELLILDKQEPLKILRLLWNSSSDTLQYSVDIIQGQKPTKRNILSQIAKIYDPLGLIGPVMQLTADYSKDDDARIVEIKTHVERVSIASYVHELAELLPLIPEDKRLDNPKKRESRQIRTI